MSHFECLCAAHHRIHMYQGRHGAKWLYAQTLCGRILDKIENAVANLAGCVLCGFQKSRLLVPRWGSISLLLLEWLVNHCMMSTSNKHTYSQLRPWLRCDHRIPKGIPWACQQYWQDLPRVATARYSLWIYLNYAGYVDLTSIALHI